MADWVWVESPGTTLDEEPRLREASFGDGYVQRAPDGINNRPQKWELSFDDVDDVEADSMIAFLRTHNGVTPFNYWPMWASAAIKVVCKRWRRTLGSKLRTSTITATFEQDFAPA